MRFLSCVGVLGVFEDDTITSKDSKRSPKSSKDLLSLRMHINASSLPVLFTSRIRDCEERSVI